jgi:hypothetical protein
MKGENHKCSRKRILRNFVYQLRPTQRRPLSLSPEYWYFFGPNFDPEFLSFDITNLVHKLELPPASAASRHQHRQQHHRQLAASTAFSTAASTSARLPMRNDENAINIDN